MKKQAKKQTEQAESTGAAEEAAATAAIGSAFVALQTHLALTWKHAGLGTEGVVVVPKDWNEGPERRRLAGLEALLTSTYTFNVTVQVSETREAMALLNSRDQTKPFREFIQRHQKNLILMSVL